MSIDLQLFNQVFDDIALNFSRHFFYELNGKVILFVKEFTNLLKLIFEHHHKDIMHNNNMLCKYDSLCHLFFLKVHHKC